MSDHFIFYAGLCVCVCIVRARARSRLRVIQSVASVCECLVCCLCALGVVGLVYCSFCLFSSPCTLFASVLVILVASYKPGPIAVDCLLFHSGRIDFLCSSVLGIFILGLCVRPNALICTHTNTHGVQGNRVAYMPQMPLCMCVCVLVAWARVLCAFQWDGKFAYSTQCGVQCSRCRPRLRCMLLLIWLCSCACGYCAWLHRNSRCFMQIKRES